MTRYVTSHFEILDALIDPAGLDLLDIGAGDGTFCNALAARGARVTGVEIDAQKVARAREGAAPGVQIVEGVAEHLPLPGAAFDLACFVYSLHHVPLSEQSAALGEIERVLRPGGRLLVIEPRPYGSMSTVIAPVEDETHVREVSQRRIEALGRGPSFDLRETQEYVLVRPYENAEALIRQAILVNPERAARLPAARGEIESRFTREARHDEGGPVLDQPTVLYLLERTHASPA